MAEVTRNALRGALTLALVVAVGFGILLGLRALGAERIAAHERDAARRALAALLPAGVDNDVEADRVAVTAPAWLGTAAPMAVRRARGAGALRGLLVEAVAPDGYSGDIRLLVGVDAAGTVLGVRVLEHRETPGLGDAIDGARSGWITQFAGRSLGDPAPSRWRVEREGGDFDQLAGATVSARAVIDAVRRTLQFIEAHGAALAAAEPGERLHFGDAPPPADGGMP